MAMTPDTLKQIREQLGLSQAGLARLLRLHPVNGDRTVRRWEHGQVTIPGPATVAVELLDIYGVPASMVTDATSRTGQASGSQPERQPATATR